MNKKIGNFRWTICALLFFVTTINYLDRQVLSLLAPELSDIFGWSNTDYGNITAVFQFVYAIFFLVSGRLIDKLGTRGGFAIAVALWSIGAIIHAYALTIGDAANSVLQLLGFATVPVSIIGFMIARAVLGIGESASFPAAVKATAEYFPKKERSFATGIFNSGSNVGAILAPLAVPWLSQQYGWQSAFELVGGIGFIWFFFWLWIYRKPDQQKRLSKKELAYIRSDVEKESLDKTIKTSWFQLLKYKQTWAFIFGKFLTDGVWWFFLFWLPIYLESQYDVKGTDLALPIAVLYSMTMVGSIWGGYFPAHFIKKGMNPYKGRMKAMFIIALFPFATLLAQPLGGYSFWFPVFLIGIGASAHQAWSANIYTTVSDMFPNKAVASVIGIGSMAGGLGGVVIQHYSGQIFDYYKELGHLGTGYTIVFTFCGIAYLIAWIIMKTLVPHYKLIKDL